MKKIREKSGISRLAVLLLVLIALLALVAIGIPGYQYIKALLDRTGCISAMDNAEKVLSIEYLSGNENASVVQLREGVAYALSGRDQICPGGGTIYVIEDEDGGPAEAVCGLHEKDSARRTRLNSSFVMEQVEEALTAAQVREQDAPDRVETTLNGETLVAERVEEKLSFRRGTATTRDYEDAGTVAFYMVDEEGNLSWFCFADEDHCALWENNLWSGDSYE